MTSAPRERFTVPREQFTSAARANRDAMRTIERMKRLLLLIALTSPLAASELPKKIDAYVAPYVAHHAFSGVILVGKGDDVVFAKPYGMANYEFSVPMTAQTRFPIASITKMFTAAILSRLYEEQKLAPSDVLAKWVPDFPSADKITIAHLANHRSGVRDPESLRRIIRGNITTAQVVDILKKTPLASAPGETYSYTTANYAILAHVIERVTGRTYAEVIREYVYKPAGMNDSGSLTTTTVVPRLTTGYMPDPFGDGISVCGPEDTAWKAGGGSEYSTARDLQRFMRAFYGGKLFHAKPLEVWPASKMFDKTVVKPSGAFPGANANVTSFIDDGITIVVLSNNYSPIAGTMSGDIASMYFGKPYTNPSFPKLQAAPLDARALGTYSLESFPNPFTVVDRGGHGVVVWNEIRQSAMLPVAGAERKWFMPLEWGTFELNGDFSEGTFNAAWGSKTLKVTRLK
jgi:CubicO group peptidase (beta-lactamase class C family)